ncbi:MAG: gas vesicle protein [Deltaproteobacteria bacterium]
MAIEAEIKTMNSSATLVDVIDRVLDKGIVINADIAISIAGTELLNIRIRAAIASFETAAKYGMAFPLGTNLETAAWSEAMVSKENCPGCKKRQPVEELLNSGCPWCGWVSARASGLKQGPDRSIRGQA